METIIPSPSQYKHQPLDIEQPQIRLLCFSNAQTEPSPDSISVSLKIFNLENCPPYKALSYMWGPPKPDREILIDGRSFRIRENLWRFLQSLQKITPDSAVTHRVRNFFLQNPEFVKQGYFWIDQICIQQYDTTERNDQVKRMGQIYQGASEVLIWLGISNNDDDKRTIASLKKRAIPISNSAAAHSSTLRSKHVMDLSLRPYWQRLWVIQEIMLARKVTIIHDDKIEEWEGVFGPPVERQHRARKNMEGLETLPKIVQSIVREREAFQKLGPGRSLSYVLELFSFEGSECQNPRDKIYGLLGLVKESAAVDIDYEKSVEEVFFDVMSKIVRDERYLSLSLLVEFSTLLRTSMHLPPLHADEIEEFILDTMKREDEYWKALWEPSRQAARELLHDEMNRLRRKFEVADQALETFFLEAENAINVQDDKDAMAKFRNYASRSRDEVKIELIDSAIGSLNQIRQMLFISAVAVLFELNRREKDSIGDASTLAVDLRRLCEILQEE